MTKKRTVVFIASMGFFAFVAWIGGYDFNERNFYVAWGAVVATFFSAAIASGVEP